jgi:hypothetical protein
VSASAAAELARVRRRFPLRSIRPVDSGTGFTAQRGIRQVYAPTLAWLEEYLSGKTSRLRR